MNISAINNAAAAPPNTSINQNIQPLYTSSTKATESSSNTNSTPSLSTIDSAVKSLNNYASSTDSTVSFHIDNSSGKVVIKIMDTNNLQLISQMPSQQALIMAQTLSNNPTNPATGVILQAQA